MVATEHLWIELRGALTAFFRKRVADEHLAEDLLQETFVRVHDARDQVVDEERIAAWVFRVARNVLAAHRRRAPPPIESRDEGSIEERVETENFNREVEQWLREMTSVLPPEQREAVELAELQGMTSEAIARALGLSVSGAKSRVQRGREKLRSLLLDCCHLDFDRRGNVVDYEKHGRCPHCDAC